jgi:hypothetical protein
MAMLACTHHVAWLKQVANGKHQCTYCKAVVAKKDLNPKIEELGADFLARWDAHEKTGPAPVAPPPAAKPAAAVAAPAKAAAAAAAAVTAPTATPAAPASAPTPDAAVKT